MTGVIRGNRYFVEGREVTKEEFDLFFPDVRDEPTGTCSLVSFKPVHSEAMAVHLKQIPEAIEDAKRKGVPTEFDPEGRPVFTSSRHFRRYARAYGFRHKGY